jgi:hypothetical protein
MNSAPPKIHRAPVGTRLAGIILAGATMAVCAVVYFFNPTTSRLYPACRLHQLTGLNCPGCGMTRAFHALLHGDLMTALRDNALFIALMLAAAFRAAWFVPGWIRNRPNGGFFPAKFLWLLLGLALVFSVLRNLPGFAFLSPETS